MWSVDSHNHDTDFTNCIASIELTLKQAIQSDRKAVLRIIQSDDQSMEWPRIYIERGVLERARTRGLAMWPRPSFPALTQVPWLLATRMDIMTFCFVPSIAASQARRSSSSSALDLAIQLPPSHNAGVITSRLFRRHRQQSLILCEYVLRKEKEEETHKRGRRGWSLTCCHVALTFRRFGLGFLLTNTPIIEWHVSQPEIDGLN